MGFALSKTTDSKSAITLMFVLYFDKNSVGVRKALKVTLLKGSLTELGSELE